MRNAIAAFFALVALCAPCQAATSTLNLSGDEFWVVLSSAQDADEAIGDGMTFMATKKVVRAVNGWFAAIAGPYHVASGTGRAFLDAQIKEHGFPKDAYFTRGASFTDVVWVPPDDRVVGSLAYDGEHDVTMRKDDLEIRLTRQAADKDSYNPLAVGIYKGKEAFRMLIDENASEKPSTLIQLVRLDPNSQLPQVVFTYYWQGAHCCTVTKIATLSANGIWHVVNGDTLDSDGYQFKDINRSGAADLVSYDNSFYYTFASYAGSFSPVRIQRLRGDHLEDVTTDAEFRHTVFQDLFRIQKYAKGDDDIEKNGYLAAWVADSIRVGRGDTAWTQMLGSYDHNSDFGPEKCTEGLSIDKCPDDKKVKLAFPYALKQFLKAHGYINDPERYPAPTDVEQKVDIENSQSASASASSPPQLNTCVNASDSVQKIVYEIFAGRKIMPGETYDMVSLQGDTTFEDYDNTTRKITCAVSYVFPLRVLIGRVAEEGNIARAAALNRLARTSGGSASKRVHYTVKPTATAGTEYVEVLP